MKKNLKKIKQGLKLVNQIQKIRGKNNKNWMDLLRLSLKLDFNSTSKKAGPCLRFFWRYNGRKFFLIIALAIFELFQVGWRSSAYSACFVLFERGTICCFGYCLVTCKISRSWVLSKIIVNRSADSESTDNRLSAAVILIPKAKTSRL